MNERNFDVRDTALRSSHCQTVRTRKPSARSSFSTRMSRSRLALIFARQNWAFFFGKRPRRQLCPCQKHPCTKMHHDLRQLVISGHPGRRVGRTRNLTPRECRIRRTAISGAVFRTRTLRITSATRTEGGSQTAGDGDCMTKSLLRSALHIDASCVKGALTSFHAPRSSSPTHVLLHGAAPAHPRVRRPLRLGTLHRSAVTTTLMQYQLPSSDGSDTFYGSPPDK